MNNVIELKNFQKNAIEKLHESFNYSNSIVILKSPTGSGKTILLTHFIDEFIKQNRGYVFIWLTPGKGNLEEQSKEKMDRFIHNSSTKLLSDVMIDGFAENDVCFINWELLTKKGNNAFKDIEKDNFNDHIKKAKDQSLRFVIIIDEEHVNDTYKADEIVQLLCPEKVIRCSATPKDYTNPIVIEILEDDVIAEGLIKKQILINENFPEGLNVENQVEYLLEKAMDKQSQIRDIYRSKTSNINPLVLIQVPNSSDVMINDIEKFLDENNVNYENGLLGIWLSNRKENLDDIEKEDNRVSYLIMKQAVATGWDCPRAHVLVKLRDNMDEVFEIQTIGRIRRMPEARHYDHDILDSSFIYTLDEKFVENVKNAVAKRALNATTLFLKKDYSEIKLMKQLKSETPIGADPNTAIKSIISYYFSKYKLSTKPKENRTRLETQGYTFSEDIIKTTSSGSVHILTSEEFENLRKVGMIETLNTHVHGRAFHKTLGLLGSKIGMPYDVVRVIVRRLFDNTVPHINGKIVSLDTRLVYSFVINNFDKLKNDFSEAMADINQRHLNLKVIDILERQFTFAPEILFTYDSGSKIQRLYTKNVYSGYVSSAEPRSNPEKEFEKHCEYSPKIKWFYKNGDKGDLYFSIIYYDNSGKQKTFYPDYIVSDLNGIIWIIETKGGFDKKGNSEDIDLFSSKKFDVLKKYAEEKGLKSGFVRKDKQSNELLLCYEKYDEDINSEYWTLLEDTL